MNKKIFLKTLKVLLIVIICFTIFLGLFKLAADYLIHYMNENNFGVIVISDAYSVVKVSAGKSALSSSIPNGVNETENILKVGWNKKYIIYVTETRLAYVDMHLNERTYFT